MADSHIVCDIDKTYLETELESLVKLAKTALEKAHEKKTVSGAADVLSAFRESYNGEQRAVHFVSSSPEQLRSVLSEKFRLDKLVWDSDTFKNQAYNLRKIRFSQLLQQIPYKSAAIVNLMYRAKAHSQFFMVGDNSESDAIIYLGIKHFAEGRLSRTGYSKYLRIFGVDKSQSIQLVRSIRIPSVKVAKIFIRRIPEAPFVKAPLLTTPIVGFDHFYQVYHWFYRQHMICPSSYRPIIEGYRQRQIPFEPIPIGEELPTPLHEEQILASAADWAATIRAMKRYS